MALAQAPAASQPAGSFVKMAVLPDTPPKEVASASFDTADGWDQSGLPEDKPMTYRAVTGADNVHEGAGAVEFTLNADVGAMGMKYFHLEKLKGSFAESDGFAFWLHGDGSGGTVGVRLSQSDWSAWDSPLVTLDFVGWRQVVVLKSQCLFQNWGRNGPKWEDLKIFALRFSGKSGKCIVDDLRFYQGTAALKVETIPAAGQPVTLQVDISKELPPIPSTLKGVDFALINWGAGGKDLNFGPLTEKLFRQSGAKMVRFWTYCPPLDVSPAEGQYNWTRFDGQMEKIYAAGAETIMTCCFTPTWLSVDGTKEGMPKDWAAYEKLIGDTVKHCKQKGWKVRYWEVWNEPNLGSGGFLKGKMPDLLEIYRHFTKAVRAADPEALVGATGLASPDVVWMRGIADYVDKNSLPLDFLSWHVYDLSPVGLSASIEAAKKILAEHPKYKDTRLVIDEWQSSGGPSNQYDTEFAAAYQVAAMHRMLEGGLNAQTFFAFKESTPDFAGTGDSWGMITRGEAPKASYHSFRIFAELTGPRLAVTGEDGEVGAIAARSANGIDVMIYRFQGDPNAPDRTVRLSVPGLSGPVGVTLELVDNAHSNPMFNREIKDLQMVGRWAPVDAKDLSKIELKLRPLSIARVRITSPVAAQAGQQPPLMEAAPAPVLFARQVVTLPAAAGKAEWTLPMGWKLNDDGQTVTVPASERTARRVYFTAAADGGAGTWAADLVPPGLTVTTAMPAPLKAGAPGEVTLTVRNDQLLRAKGELSLWTSRKAAVKPATPVFDLAPGTQSTLKFEMTPESAGAEPLILYPRVTVTGLDTPQGQPLTVALPDPLSKPEKDAYTTLLSSMSSADAITKPQAGPGGTVDASVTFEEGKFGPAALLKEGAVVFPSEAFSTPVGTLEMWISPKWDGKDAPGWGTLFLRSGTAGWAKSMLDLQINEADGQRILRCDLYEEDGKSHTVAGPIQQWQAGQPHHIMVSWNVYTGRIAMYLDGKLAQEQRVEGGLSLGPATKDLVMNKIGGRAPCNALFGPIRLSNVERIPGTPPPPKVEIRTVGVEVPVGG